MSEQAFISKLWSLLRPDETITFTLTSQSFAFVITKEDEMTKEKISMSGVFSMETVHVIQDEDNTIFSYIEHKLRTLRKI